LACVAILAKQARLLAFDLQTDQLVKRNDFPSQIAGFGSFLYETKIVNVCTTDKIAVENRSHNLKLRCKSM